MTDYTVMCWNLQNLYEYKSTMPGEVPADGSPQAKKQKTSATKVYESRQVNHRGTAVDIVLNVNPDIFVVVELAVGKTDLQVGGSLESSWAAYEHFGVFNLLVSLNDRYAQHGIGRVWECAQSVVNASDAKAAAAAVGITVTNTNNSMFEQYGIFWRTDKFTYVPPGKPGPPTVEILNTDAAGAKLDFPQRAPGGIRLTEVGGSKGSIYVVMHHSVWGKSETDRRSTIVSLAKVGRISTESRVVLVGDFNLDYITDSKWYAPLVALPMAVRNGANPTSSVSASGASLKNAYDQAFDKGVTPASPKGGPYNFVTEVCAGNWEYARQISDHLPISANITLP